MIASRSIRLLLISALFTGLLTTAQSGCANPGQPPEAKVIPPVKQPPAVPTEKPTSIDASLQAEARKVVESALASSDPLARAHAIEVLKAIQSPNAAGIIIPALADASPLVRKSAALAAGELALSDAHDALQQSMADLSVRQRKYAALPQTDFIQERISLIFALHRIGDTHFSHELERTATDTDPHVRGDTALVLGMLGDKSSVPILMSMMRRDKEAFVRLQAAEALWRMGEEHALEELVGATISRYPDDQMLALLALAEPHDTRMLGHIEGQLTADYQEVALMAARAAGMLGSDRGYTIAVNAASAVDPRQRALSAFALGAIGRKDAQAVLGKLLKDEQGDVRLAAAQALLEIAKGS